MYIGSLVVAAFLLLLGAGASSAFAQQAPDGPMRQQGPSGGMMHQSRGGGMAPGMMGRGMMGSHGMGAMMRIAFILMDGDGDGVLSLEEFRAGHDRIFKGLDANKNGQLTLEEMQSFMQGSGRSPRAPGR